MNVTVPVASIGRVAVKATETPNVEGFNADTRLMVGVALFTVCVNTLEVAALKLESPPYEAVMECDPTAKAVVDNVAAPPLSVPVPRVFTPSRNVTVPVAAAGSVAVNVTEAPFFDGLREEVRPTVGDAVLTVCVNGLEVAAT